MTGDSVVGIYGKSASQPDFLRANAGEFSQCGLDRWFQAGVEALGAERNTLPVAPTAFVLAPSGMPSAFIGAFAPSADAAGRAFPLAVFVEVAASGLSDGLGSVPSAYARFLDGAKVLAVAGSHVPGADLITQAQALAVDLPPAGSVGPSTALHEPAQPLLASLGGSPAALGYAMRTFTAALDQAAKTGPDAQSGVVTVDAPAPTASVREAWLELARRRLRWRSAAPSLLWTDERDGQRGRLLIMLGQPPSAALTYLANPRSRAPRFWPLRTEALAAIDQAMKALTPEQRLTVEDPRLSLGELVAAFA